MRACYTELQNYSGEQNYVYLSRMPHREDLFEIILNLDLWFEIFYFFFIFDSGHLSVQWTHKCNIAKGNYIICVKLL